MLSGIGDCDDISKHSIDCKVHLPGVGKNLQEHIFVFISYQFAAFGDDDDLTPILSELPYFDTTGDIPPGIWGAQAVSNTSKYFLFIGQFGSFSGDGDLNRLNVAPAVNTLDSIGTVTLENNDSGAAPVIDHNYLGDKNGNDMAALVEAFKRGREIIENSHAFDDLANDYNIGIIEISPGSDVESDEEIKEFLRNNLGSTGHPGGSCKMGKQSDVDNGDDSIVVNEKLKVIGVDALRIADASIVPMVVSANINQMTMVIGKKAAKFIANDQSKK